MPYDDEPTYDDGEGEGPTRAAQLYWLARSGFGAGPTRTPRVSIAVSHRAESVARGRRSSEIGTAISTSRATSVFMRDGPDLLPKQTSSTLHNAFSTAAEPLPPLSFTGPPPLRRGLSRRLTRTEAQRMGMSSGRWVPVLDPRSYAMGNWDLIMFALIIFTAVVTPFEVGFIRLSPYSSPLFIFNRIVDCLFAIDVCLNLNLMFFDELEGRWVANRRRIAERYLLGMASIDIVSTIPFDTLVSVGGGEGGTGLEAVRTLRILRLIKLLRILRASRVLRRLEDQFFLHYLHATLIKLLMATCMITHWMACLFHLIAESSPDPCNWVDK